MNRVILKKENGVVSITKPDEQLLRKLNCSDHLCWEKCSAECMATCPKILDETKKEIKEYNFITDGIQIVDKNGKLETFIVTNCQRCDYKQKEEPSAQELKKAREIRRNLVKMYYEAETLEEAYEKQKELESHSNYVYNNPNREYISSPYRLRTRK